MKIGELAERIRDDMEMQAVASVEALKYWKGRGMTQSESYWDGWGDRGGAIAQAIRLAIGPEDFSKYTQDLLGEKDATIKALRIELKETQSRLKKAKQQTALAKTEARYQKVKRLIAGGARIVEDKTTDTTYYKIKTHGGAVNIPYEVMQRLEKESIQLDIWTAKPRKAA